MRVLGNEPKITFSFRMNESIRNKSRTKNEKNVPE